MDSDRYATASQRLARYAELNKDDSLFERQKGEIVYIFDTSVLESYWRKDLRGIGGRFGTDDLLTEQAAVYSGWLALKYLIEHRLPGQKKTGFISPSHWNEAMDRLQKLETETRTEFKFEPEEREYLEASLRSLGALDHDPEGLLKAAESLQIGKYFTTIMQAVSRAERVRRVFQDGRNKDASVRDLTMCEYYGGLAGPRVRHQDFRRWHSAISQHRRGNSDSAKTRNLESDAMTLASIQTMYRGNLAAVGDKPTVRFVFITADVSIHEAYAQIDGLLEREGIPYFLRHPHVYAPLLNHANMSQGGIPKEKLTALRLVFDRVEQALEPLFHDYDLRSRLIQGYDRNLTYNVALWSKNVETICLANSHYVLSDVSGEYVTEANLARILSAPDVREAAAEAVSADIGQIRDGHLQLMSLVALDALEKTGNEMKAGASAFEHRAPVKLVGVDIAKELGYPPPRDGHTRWLDELLRSFRASQSSLSHEEVLERLRTSWNNPKLAPAVQLLASCIFFTVNSWESARLCAVLCDQGIRRKRYRNIWIREANYCEALAIRMQLRSQSDVSRAHSLLTRNLGEHSNSIASVRDRVERASLSLTAAIVQTIEDHLYQQQQDEPFIDLISRENLAQDFDHAISDLHAAMEDLDRYTAPGDAQISQRIRIQAETNLLGAHLFAFIFEKPVTEEPVSRDALALARQTLADTLSRYSFKPSLNASVYLCVSKAIVSEEAEFIDFALSYLKSSDVVDLPRSRPDGREITHLTEYLKLLSAKAELNIPM